MPRTRVRKSVLLPIIGVSAVALVAGALVVSEPADADANMTAFGVTADELDRLQREKKVAATEAYNIWKAEQDRIAAEAEAARVAAEAEAARVAAEAEAARVAAEAAAKAQAEADAKAAADRAAAARKSSRSSARAAGPVASGSPREIGLQMVLARGWSEGQFGCLDSLYQRESGWNPNAHNSSSGAHGIPQALPGSKMASHGSDWATNPATQIAWGLDYIAGRYGDPCGAWSHWQAKHWY
ncbi:MAG: transglycosylase SLT domain-containing protein [Candidatus Nanopelagicales bacterium]